MPEYSPAKSLWGQALIGLWQALLQVNVEGFPSSNAVIQKLSHNLKAIKPGLFVSPVPERLGGRGNASDVWTFRNQVTYVVASNGDIDTWTAIDAYLYARQRMFEELLPTYAAILGSTLWHTLEIEPGAVYDPTAFERGFDGQAFVVAVSHSKPRKRPSGT